MGLLASGAAAQPINDTCENAAAIGALPYDSGDLDAFGATDDTVNPSCDASGNTAGANNGVWFVFTPATTGPLILSEVDTLDTATSVWTGTCGALTQVHCSDPDTSTFTFNAGTTYYILVSRWSATNPTTGATYQFTLGQGGTCCNPATDACTFVTAPNCPAPRIFTAGGACSPNPCTAPPVPPNDLCAAAISLTEGVTVSGNNASATSTGDGPAPSCQSSSTKGVWYTFSPTTAGTFEISACGSPQDTVLTVFNTTDCLNFAQVTGGCDDDSCDAPNGTASLIRTLTLTPGTYHIRLSSFGSTATGNDFSIVVNRVTAGACCNNSTGACTFTTAAGCASTSAFQGDGTTCEPNTCPQPGRCCTGTCCTVIVQNLCTGTFTPGGTCAAGACGAPAGDDCASPRIATVGANAGSNCGANTSVVITPASQCGALSGAGGARDVFYSFTAPASTTYTFDTCDATGFDTTLAVYSACPVDNSTAPLACNDDATTTNCPASGVRSRIADLALTGGQTYIVRVAAYAATTPAEGNFVLNIAQAGGGTTGACCRGTTCSVTEQSACTGANTRFAGVGSACNAAGNNTAPCCRADFNQVGGVTVQDIFDFLAAYFTNDPLADINGVGGVTVQDIFDFLAAYFAGCPCRRRARPGAIRAATPARHAPPALPCIAGSLTPRSRPVLASATGTGPFVFPDPSCPAR